jgi:intracellular septation protein
MAASMSETLDQNPMRRLALEAGPLVVFFLANQFWGIMVATALFIAATLIAVAASIRIERRWPVMPIVSCFFVVVFGGLTLWLDDAIFIKIKPTIVNLLFAALLFFGLATGRNLLKIVMGQMLDLSEGDWRTLTWRWAGFFVVLAIVNEVVWRSFSTEFWAGFKLFGIMPLTILFAMAQLPLIMRSQSKADAQAKAETS